MRVPLTLLGRTLRSASLVSPRLAGRLAFALFTTPGPRARVRPEERTVHEQARTSRLPIAGRQVVVYEWGDGPRPVLMLHGWGSRGSRFAPLVTELRARGLRPITFDAPGHGRSPGRRTNILEFAAISRNLCDQYGRFDAVIGYSFGALAAFHALRTGASTDRLVAISGPGDFGYLPAAFASQLGLGPRLLAELRRRTERFLAPETDIWRRFSAHHQPSDLPMPMLVVHDDTDPVVDPQQAHRVVAAYAPRARLLATHGLGHRRILSAPEVADQVADFVASPVPATP